MHVDMKTPPRSFRFRGCTSVVVALCFVALVVTGAVMFLAPPGRVANWTDWRIAGLGKHDWGDVHIVFGAVFLLGSLLHLWFNWKPLVSYFKNKATQARGMRWEWIVALLLCLGVFLGTRAGVPPFSTLLDWNEQLKNSWEEPATRAPIPHAEDLSLAELAEEAAVPLATAKERLVAAGLQGVTDHVVIHELAEQNDTTPVHVHELIRGAGGCESGEEHGGGGNGAGGAGRGGGYGRKTLRQFCEEEGFAVEQAQERLEAAGIEGQPDQTLRDIAHDNDLEKPSAILTAIRGK